MSPLMKSIKKENIYKNAKVEMEAGKPKDQSFAIALSVQRQARKKKKMADGGQVPAPKNSPAPDVHQAATQEMSRISNSIDSRMKAAQAQGKPGYAKGGAIKLQTINQESNKAPAPKSQAKGPSTSEYMAQAFADGGMVDSIADAVIERMHRKMAAGGEVDIQSNGDEEGSSPYDDYNAEATESPGVYDDSQLSDQPEDSNEYGDESEDEEENKNDRISAIRRRMKSR